jgi:hypothetical protein
MPAKRHKAIPQCAPDAIYVPASGRLADVKTLAALGAVRASIATFNKRAWSAAGNLFWTPIKNIDLGIEYRHGERRLVNGADGALDRIEFAAKYSFWRIATGEIR